jgi:hypothetical protein
MSHDHVPKACIHMEGPCNKLEAQCLSHHVVMKLICVITRQNAVVKVGQREPTRSMYGWLNFLVNSCRRCHFQNMVWYFEHGGVNDDTVVILSTVCVVR